MSDIELRFGHDMLVLSAPIDATLARQGIDAARDRQYLNLMEPDAIADALRLEMLAGAHCLVTTTEDITRARLAHVRMEGDSVRLAHAALEIASDLKPQHILAEIGPCGLPLDASSKASLNENRSQYADAARAFDGCAFDAFFLNGFASLDDLKCALMGVAQVSGKPVFASVVLGVRAEAGTGDAGAGAGAGGAADADDAGLGSSMVAGDDAGSDAVDDAGADAGASVDARDDAGAAEANAPMEDDQMGAFTAPIDGANLFSRAYELIDGPIAPAVPKMNACLAPDLWPDAIAVMVDLGVSVVGFETAEPLGTALAYARLAVQMTDLPVLAQLCVGEDAANAADARAIARARALVPIEERDDYALDTMERAAVRLYGAGVQFLRATGSATPAYTGALAATVSGLDVLARR